MLLGLYVGRGLTTLQLGALFSCSRETICQRLTRHSIPRRTRGGANHNHQLFERLRLVDPRLVWDNPKEAAFILEVSTSTIYNLRKEFL